MGFLHVRHKGAEGGAELGVVEAEADKGFHAALGQAQQAAVIVALVGAAGNPDDGLVNTIEGVPGGLHVGGLAVVDVAYAVDFAHQLQAVVGILEGSQASFDLRSAKAGYAGGQHGGQDILAVVLPNERRIGSADVMMVSLVYFHRAQGSHQLVLGSVVASQVDVVPVVQAERQPQRGRKRRLEKAVYHFIIRIVDEGPLAVEVAGNA